MSALTYSRFSASKTEIAAIAAKYTKIGEKVADTTPAMDLIADYLQLIFEKNFESWGRRKGGSWPALKQATIKKKLRLVGAGGGHRLQGGYAFGGGFFIRPKGSSGVKGVFRPAQGAIHVYEPVRLTDRLFNAASGKSSETVRQTLHNKALVGVEGIPYAKVQRFGGGNKIPARDYMMVDEQDRIEMLRILETYIFQVTIGGQRRPKGLGGFVFG